VDLTLATREVDGRAVVAVGGEIDVYTAPKLRDQITELVGSGSYNIVIDLETMGRGMSQVITVENTFATPLPVALYGVLPALITVAGIGVLVGGWLQQRVPLWRIRLVSGGLLAILATLTVVELVRG